MEKLCTSCGTMAPAELREGFLGAVDNTVLRHLAPCGAVCIMGSANGPGFKHSEKTHYPPWEANGHYHGECPNGCFKDCCDPPGNLCGPGCQQCFSCRKCDLVHPTDQDCPKVYSGLYRNQ